MNMSELNVDKEFAKDHNIICHPAVCYTRSFWEHFGPYDPTTIPREDLLLWKKARKKGAKFGITPQILCCYRIHPNQITAKK